VKFKLDENLGTRTQNIFLALGHDVKTVREEGLSGTSDDNLFQICQNETRCLLTLDLDFANILRFPHEKTEGVVVFRLPNNPKLLDLETLAHQFLKALEQMPVKSNLWIVEIGHIRVHERSDTEET